MSAVRNQVPPPSDPIARPRRKEFGPGKDPQEGTLTDTWSDYFAHQTDLSGKFPARVANVTTSSSTSIGTTDMSGGIWSAGLYEVNWYVRCTDPGSGLGDKVQVSVSFTEGGVTRAISGSNITLVTPSTDFECLGARLMKIDALTAVSYSTTYTAAGGVPATYALDIIVNEVLA